MRCDVSELARKLRGISSGCKGVFTLAIIEDAADALERLEAENRKLREALVIVQDYTADVKERDNVLNYDAIKYLEHKARAALAESEAGGAM